MHKPGPTSSVHTPIYLDTSGTVDAFFDDIADTRILALDTEGASFHRFVDRIYLLQVSTREKTAVIDPLPIGTPAELGALVEDPSVEIVFHDADYDLRLLNQDNMPTAVRAIRPNAAATITSTSVNAASRRDLVEIILDSIA